MLTIVACDHRRRAHLQPDRHQGFFWQRYNLKTRFGNVAGRVGVTGAYRPLCRAGTVTSVELVAERGSGLPGERSQPSDDHQ